MGLLTRRQWSVPCSSPVTLDSPLNRAPAPAWSVPRASRIPWQHLLLPDHRGTSRTWLTRSPSQLCVHVQIIGTLFKFWGWGFTFAITLVAPLSGCAQGWGSPHGTKKTQLMGWQNLLFSLKPAKGGQVCWALRRRPAIRSPSPELVPSTISWLSWCLLESAETKMPQLAGNSQDKTPPCSCCCCRVVPLLSHCWVPTWSLQVGGLGVMVEGWEVRGSRRVSPVLVPHCPGEEDGDRPLGWGTRILSCSRQSSRCSPGRNSFQETNVLRL